MVVDLWLGMNWRTRRGDWTTFYRAYIIQTRTILNYRTGGTYSYIFNDLFFAILAHWPARSPGPHRAARVAAQVGVQQTR